MLITKEVLIGEITHFFSQIMVAVLKLSKDLAVGDEIRITGGETEFTQKVKSMEIDKQKIEKAKKGQSVGLKVEAKVRPGYKVFKL